MKPRNLKQSQLQLDTSLTSEMQDSASVMHRNLLTSLEKAPTSKRRSFKLSNTCAGNLNLDEVMKSRSRQHQSRTKGVAMQTAIKLIYKYQARSISELFDKCSSDEFASVVYLSPDYSKIVRPALDLYIKDSLEFQRRDRWEYMMGRASPNPAETAELLRLFQTQDIDPITFAIQLRSVLKCEFPKINTIRLVGVPNSGKSLIGQLISKCFISCYANNHGSENEFFMSNFLNKSLILCEELYVTQATCEDFKSILAGAPIDISKKYSEKQILSRTPVIITSNFSLFGRGHLSTIDENALSSRCFSFRFSFPFTPKVAITAPSMYHFLWLCVNQDIL